MIALIFNVIPDAVSDFQKLVADLFGIAYGILLSAQLDPPEVRIMNVMAAVRKIVLAGITISPSRRNKLLGRGSLPRLNEATHAHGLLISFRGLDIFSEFPGSFPAHPEFGAGEGRQNAVPGTIGEELGFHSVPGLGGELPAFHSFDAVASHLQLTAAAVQK